MNPNQNTHRPRVPYSHYNNNININHYNNNGRPPSSSSPQFQRNWLRPQQPQPQQQVYSYNNSWNNNNNYNSSPLAPPPPPPQQQRHPSFGGYNRGVRGQVNHHGGFTAVVGGGGRAAWGQGQPQTPPPPPRGRWGHYHGDIGRDYRGRTHRNPFQFREKRVKQDSFYCCSCERGFASRELLEEHNSEHIVCGLDGCQFEAHALVVTKHISMQHSGNLYERMKNLNTPEEINKWREERKSNFPTSQRVEEKARARAERLERGESCGLANEKFVYRLNKAAPEIIRYKIKASEDSGQQEYMLQRKLRKLEYEQSDKWQFRTFVTTATTTTQNSKHVKVPLISLNKSPIVLLENFYLNVGLDQEGKLQKEKKVKWKGFKVQKVEALTDSEEEGGDGDDIPISDDEDELFENGQQVKVNKTKTDKAEEIISDDVGPYHHESESKVVDDEPDNNIIISDSVRAAAPTSTPSLSFGLSLINYSSDSEDDGSDDPPDEVSSKPPQPNPNPEITLLKNTPGDDKLVNDECDDAIPSNGRITDPTIPPNINDEEVSSGSAESSGGDDDDDEDEESSSSDSDRESSSSVHRPTIIPQFGKSNNNKPMLLRTMKGTRAGGSGKASRSRWFRTKMLEMLLQDSIRKERNIILQACRYVSERNFFQDKQHNTQHQQPSQDSNDQKDQEDSANKSKEEVEVETNENVDIIKESVAVEHTSSISQE